MKKLHEIQNDIDTKLEGIYNQRFNDEKIDWWENEICNDIVEKTVDSLSKSEIDELWVNNEPLLSEAALIESGLTKEPCIDDAKTALAFNLKTRAFNWYMKWIEKRYNS